MSEGGCELGFSDARARILSTILYLIWGLTVTVFPMVSRELTVAFPHSSLRQGLLPTFSNVITLVRRPLVGKPAVWVNTLNAVECQHLIVTAPLCCALQPILPVFKGCFFKISLAPVSLSQFLPNSSGEQKCHLLAPQTPRVIIEVGRGWIR